MAGAPQRPPQAAPAGPGGPERRKAPAQQPPAAAAEAPAPEKAPAGRRNAMVPAIIVAAALLGAAFLLRGGDGGSPASVATTPTTTVQAGDPSLVVALDPITLNLADGALAKVGIAIELSSATLLAEVSEDPTNFGARALDELIEVFGDHTADQVAAKGGKAKIKALLSERIHDAYHGEVVAVYFTELAVP